MLLVDYAQALTHAFCVSFPIITPEQLPPVGTSRENTLFDFKAQWEPGKPFEMAKDVAAFANASGGTLLIGAREEERRLARYEPLSEARAADAKDAYGKQVSQRCFPAPMFDSALVVKDGGFVLAVNVWPFPGQPIGVRLQGDKAKDGYGGEGFAFPLRVGADTVWVRPEQLPMLMMADVRRVTILLEQIPSEKRQAVQVFWREYSKNGPYLEDRLLRFMGVRPMENVAVFENSRDELKRLATMYPTMPQPDGPPPPNLHVPLDAIRSVWSEGDGNWCVLMSGKLETTREDWTAFFPARVE